jgi:hypothetical protein
VKVRVTWQLLDSCYAYIYAMTGLKIVDILFTVLHLVIIGFNLLGWIWPRTRRLHFIGILVTAGCWFILGIWYGIGYCPITDWQWQVKEKLGEHDLPGSFVKYFIDKISGGSVNATLVDVMTAVCFFMAILLSVYVNFLMKGKTRNKH